jgi:hypothetical protein
LPVRRAERHGAPLARFEGGGGMIIGQAWVRAIPQEIERLSPAAVEMMHATKANKPGCLT